MRDISLELTSAPSGAIVIDILSVTIIGKNIYEIVTNFSKHFETAED